MINERTGLIYNLNQMGDDHSWLLDNSSIETTGASWRNFGYEIIYRIDEIHASKSAIMQLKRAFMKPFKLPREQYRFEPTIWRVYWDRGQLRIHMLKECEKEMDKMARKNKIAVFLNDVIIQPRPMDYITATIEQKQDNFI